MVEQSNSPHATTLATKRFYFRYRLQKENQITEEQSQTSSDISKVSVIEDIKSAVPGTPVPEKRNWVVGKFGRALPIVFLRRRDGKKIAKFDPSKTVHCLRKFSGNDFNHSHSVNSLTWNLYQSDKSRSTNRVLIKRSLDDGKDGKGNRTSSKIRTKNKEPQFKKIKSNEILSADETGYFQSSLKQHPGENESDLAQNNKSVLSTKENSTLDGEPTLCSSMNQRLDGNSTSQTTSHGNCSIDGSSSSEESITSVYDCSDDLLAPSFKNKQYKQNVRWSSKERKHENEIVYEEHSGNEVDLFLNDENEISSETEESGQVSKGKYYLPQQESPSEEKKITEHSSSNEKSFFSADSDLKLRMKKETSNKLRLKTLEERKELLKTQKEIVKNALKKVDSSSDKRGNHIVFENDNSMNGETLKLSSGREVGISFSCFFPLFISIH